MAKTTRKAKNPKVILEPSEVEPASGYGAPGCPIVGIGASAGGLAAFEAFFSGMPVDTDPGMAFVLVQHLAPDHKSILSELVERYTRMKVFQVTDGMAVNPIAPTLSRRTGIWPLSTARSSCWSRPRRAAIVCRLTFSSAPWLRTSASGPSALCSRGPAVTAPRACGRLRAKAAWPWRRTPNPPNTKACRAARLLTGLVDYVLPAAEMPAQLIAYVAHALGKTSLPIVPLAPKAEDALKKIFLLLRAQTGHDFSQYKRSTFVRRVERRMAVHQIESAGRVCPLFAANPGRFRGALSRPFDRRYQFLPRPASLRGPSESKPSLGFLRANRRAH